MGLSRKAIMSEVDASLRRLGTDYIDLYQIHRWDRRTPIEETLEALHDVVKAGKARYIGASAMFAWQFCKSLYVADLHGWTRFVSMQDHYNLIHREEEREMLPLCAAEGIGVLPWSPLARVRLTRTGTRGHERARPTSSARRCTPRTWSLTARLGARGRNRRSGARAAAGDGGSGLAAAQAGGDLP
jgi:aryl-alcohol dehydrogenase-like predicted oxidoreductase